MKVIMLKGGQKIGRAGEIKEVSDGFALNFLIPNGIAERATPEKIKQFEARKKEQSEKKKIQGSLVSGVIGELSGKKVFIRRKVNEKGHLYEEIHPEEIARAVEEELNVKIEASMVRIPHHLKGVGEYAVEIEAGERKGQILLLVEPL